MNVEFMLLKHRHKNLLREPSISMKPPQATKKTSQEFWATSPTICLSEQNSGNGLTNPL